MDTISSRRHPIVNAFRELAEMPDDAGVRLLLDGEHLVRDAHRAGLMIEAVVVAASRLEAETDESRLADELDRDGVEVLACTDQVFAAMSPVKSPSGVVAIARRTSSTFASICAQPNGFVLAATDVQDPGNLGALIRVAEAGGATGVVICGASAHPFSWKALRGSMGSALRLPIAAVESVDEVLAQLRQQGIRTIAAVPRSGRPPDEADWTGHVALLLGGEGAGLDDRIAQGCDDAVSIPMSAPVESLNVATAAAILVYAARRKRS